MRTSVRPPAVLAATGIAAPSTAFTAYGSDDSPKGSRAAATVSAEQGTSSKSDNGGADTAGSTTMGSGTSGSTGSTSTATQTVARQQATAKAPACTVNNVKTSSAEV